MKAILGKVISDKMKNTVVVSVERMIAHPMYHKRIRHNKNYHAHNEIGAKTGDMVKLIPCRPISKTKFWKVTEIIKKP
jgi:small subunit ribosomal protein S17